MEKTAKIALRYPAQLSDRTLSSITMRRPTVGDMLDYPIKNGGLDEEAALVAAPDGTLEKGLRMLAVSLSRLTRWPLRDVLALTPDEAEAWLDTACELEKRISA